MRATVAVVLVDVVAVLGVAAPIGACCTKTF